MQKGDLILEMAVGLRGVTFVYRLYESPRAGPRGLRRAYGLEVAEAGGKAVFFPDVTRLRREALSITERFANGAVPPTCAAEVLEDLLS